jgi:hypothetical protein
MNQTIGVLQSILQAPDLDRAIEEYLPECNDVFFAVLEANLENARRNKQEAAAKRLDEVKGKILTALEQSLPPELRLIRNLLGQESDTLAERMLTDHAGEINDNFVASLKAAVADLETSSPGAPAERMKKLLALAEKQAAIARFTAK